MSPRGERVLASLTAVAAWSGLILQYVIAIAAAGDGPVLATVRFFSYFTILSNLIVALTCTFTVLGRDTRAGRFFARGWVRAAATLYIAVTAGVYLTLLASLWHPTGALRVADTLVHEVVPVLYLALWALSPRREPLGWRDLPRWLIFPLVFLLWTIARGAVFREYPYPFVDVAELGLAAVLRNAAGLTVVFVVLGAALIGIDRLRRALTRAPGALRD